jgi:hypothetical protein
VRGKLLGELRLQFADLQRPPPSRRQCRLLDHGVVAWVTPPKPMALGTENWVVGVTGWNNEAHGAYNFEQGVVVASQDSYGRNGAGYVPQFSCNYGFPCPQVNPYASWDEGTYAKEQNAWWCDHGYPCPQGAPASEFVATWEGGGSSYECDYGDGSFDPFTGDGTPMEACYFSSDPNWPWQEALAPPVSYPSVSPGATSDLSIAGP